jgi:glutamyl/glutaminyl-tRNA synthetase
MGITHVLRGLEHLKNTFNHIALQEALGYRRPIYAHLSTMLNPESGEKLSKRDRDRRIRKRAQEWMRTSKRTTGELASASGIGEQRLVDWVNTDTIQLDLTEQPKVMAAVGLKEVDLPEVMIHDFRKNGYAPEVLLNFLALQGWSPGGDLEQMTIEQLIEKFSIDRLISSNPKFNREKLKSFSTDFYATAPMDKQLELLRDWLSVHPESPLRNARDEELVMLLKMNRGYRLMSDIDEKNAFFFADDATMTYDPKSVEKILTKDDGQGLSVLKSLRDTFAAVNDWTPAMLEAAVTDYVTTSGLALGKVAQPIRLALSGGSVSPPIYDTLAFLGQRRALARIDRCISVCS